MMKTLRALICIVGLAAFSIARPAWSQEVGSYPNATSPLSGTERILGDQSTSYPCTGCTVNLTPLQISNYTATQGGNFSVLFDNAGIMGGLIPGATGQYCLNWSSLTAAPTLVTCTSGGSGTVNSGTAGDLSYYATTGTAVSDLPLGAGFSTSSGTLQLTYSINAQTGTTYTVQSTDCTKLLTFSNSSAVAVTLPQATGSFLGCSFDVENLGVGTVTITPTTSTINGATTLAIPTNKGCSITSDGTNYQVSACTAVAPAGAGTVTTTGTPASGNLAAFSGSTSITNGNLSGDVTTSGTLAATVVKVNGAAVPTSATVLGSNASNQLVAATTVTYLMDTGTTFTLGTGTGGCATATTLKGGAATGSFVCTGTAGASTQVINLPSAPNGWYCSASDATSGVAWANEVGSTTTGKIGGALATTSDVVTFSCTGY